MEPTKAVVNVSCGTGFIDKTPEFMCERQKIMDVIDLVYTRHCAEKIETPVFEIKEVFSNKRFPSNKVIELDDQGGSILAMRYDLKIPLVRFLSSKKMESHRRYTQSGYVYRKEPVKANKFRFREFFVSDFDMSGPADAMMTEVQCLRVMCDLLTELSLGENVQIRIGHRKLTELLLAQACKLPLSQAAKLVAKLADDSSHGSIDWGRARRCLGEDKFTDDMVVALQQLTEAATGDFRSCLDWLAGNTDLTALTKDTVKIETELRFLLSYCQNFLNPDFLAKIQFDASLVGSQSYYSGVVFNAELNKELSLISGGRYENLVQRFNSAYKDKMGLTGFSVGVDQIVQLKLHQSSLLEDVLRPYLLSNPEAVENGDVEAATANLRIKQNFNKSVDTSKTPKGTIDREAEQMEARDSVFNTITACFKKFDAQCIDTPVIERNDVLTGKYGEDSKLIYDLDDIDGEKLSLRYDLTVPFARYLAMHPDVISEGKTFKRYQIGRVYRRDNPSISSGRYREFYQCDFDIAGPCNEYMKPDAEVLQIVHEVLRDLDLGEYRIKVNHRKLLDGLFAVCGVPSELFRAICSSVDKLDKTPWEGVRAEMLEKGISTETADLIGTYVALNGGRELVDRLRVDPVLAGDSDIQAALTDLAALFDRFPSEMRNTVQFDLSLARGLDYYTGMIFEAVISEAADASGMERVGSVSGGGRYDNLVGMFCEPGSGRIPCVGLSLGVERLMAIHQRKTTRDGDGSPKQSRRLQQVMVISSSEKHCPLASPENERMKILADLLNNGFNAQHTMKRNPKILNMFQECEEGGVPVQVVIGQSELQAGQVQLRSTRDRSANHVPIEEMIPRLRKMLEVNRVQ